MLGVLKHSEEDKSPCDTCVQAPDKDNGWNHERIRDLLVGISEDAECRCDHVLVARVNVDDRPDNAECNNLSHGASPQCLGKVSVLSSEWSRLHRMTWQLTSDHASQR